MKVKDFASFTELADQLPFPYPDCIEMTKEQHEVFESLLLLPKPVLSVVPRPVVHHGIPIKVI